MYTDCDNNDNCSLNECKYMRETDYNKLDGTFTTKPVKTRTNKNKNKNKNKSKKVENNNG